MKGCVVNEHHVFPQKNNVQESAVVQTLQDGILKPIHLLIIKS